jgi:hypothetical protein
LEDHLAGLPNPVPLTPYVYGDGQIKTANTCYLDAEQPGHADYAENACTVDPVDMISFCAAHEDTPQWHDCRDRFNQGYYDSYGNVGPARISVDAWLGRNGHTPYVPDQGEVNYNVDVYNDPDYIAPASRAISQIIYFTRVGRTYYVTIGEYTREDGPDSDLARDERYMLMGMGMEMIPSDTEADAFDRHMRRLNYGGVWTPQSFRPDYCMVGASHVVQISQGGQVTRWTTFTYQANSNFGAGGINNWYCEEG